MLKLLGKHVRDPRDRFQTHVGNKFWTEAAVGYPRAYFQSGEAQDAEHLFVCLVAPMEPCQEPPEGPGLHEAFWSGVVDNDAILDELAGWAGQVRMLPPGALAWCLVPAPDAKAASLALTTRSIAPVAILTVGAWRSAEARLRATLDEAHDVGASGFVARLLRRHPYGVLLQSPAGLRTLWYRAASLADALAAGAREKRADETVAGAVPAQDLADINGAIDNTLAGGWCVQVRIIDGYMQGGDEYKAWLLYLTNGRTDASAGERVEQFFSKRERYNAIDIPGIPETPEPTPEEWATLVRNVRVVQALAAEGVPPVE